MTPTTRVLILATALFWTAPARAQATAPSYPTALTLQCSAADGTIALRGSSDLIGAAPVDLGPEWIGTYRVVLSAPGYAVARGRIHIPGGEESPRLESGSLFLHSLYFPGVASILSGRSERGAAFMSGGVGGLAAVVRDHLEYRSKRKKLDFESQDEALDFRYARNRWEIYTAAVWGLAALDDVLRPKVTMPEASPTRVTLGGPSLTRGQVIGRSVALPGGGQDAAGREMRGALWLGAVLVSGAAYVTADESHHRIETKLSRAEALLATASPSELADRQADVAHFTDLEDRSSRLKSRLALVTLVVHLANVVDAGLLDPKAPDLEKVSSLHPIVGPRSIALSYRF